MRGFGWFRQSNFGKSLPRITYWGNREEQGRLRLPHPSLMRFTSPRTPHSSFRNGKRDIGRLRLALA